MAAEAMLPKTKAAFSPGAKAACRQTQAVTIRAATVDTYMNTAGQRAHW